MVSRADIMNVYLLFDGRISVKVTRRGVASYKRLNDCVQRAIGITEQARSQGAYKAGDVLLSIPVAVCDGWSPQMGDVVTMSDVDDLMTTDYVIMAFDIVTLRTRYRCQLRSLAVAGYFATTVAIYVDKGNRTDGMGAPVVNLEQIETGRAARVEPTNNVERIQNSRRMFIPDVDIVLSTVPGEMIDLGPQHWIEDLTTGQRYRVMSIADQQSLGNFTIVNASSVTP